MTKAYETQKQNDSKVAETEAATVQTCYGDLTSDASAVMDQLAELMKTGNDEKSSSARLECEKRVDESIRKLDMDRALYSIATDLEPDKESKNRENVVDVLKRKRSGKIIQSLFE